MLKFIGGIVAVFLGVSIGVWVAYNLLVQRQREFTGNPLPALVFTAVLLGVGGKWLVDGWGSFQEEPRPRKRKKKRRREHDEDEDE